MDFPRRRYHMLPSAYTGFPLFPAGFTRIMLLYVYELVVSLR